jgi:exonuclease III
MRIVFWNTNRKSYTDDILELAKDQDVDILVLADCTVSGNLLIDEFITQFPLRDYNLVGSPSHKKFILISRIPSAKVENFDQEFGGASWSINRFNFSVGLNFSLVTVHLPSKLYWDSISQSFEVINMMQYVRKYEEINGQKTIVMGDFNMNPYEPAMVAANGLHGMSDLNIVKKRGREVLGNTYDYFYNPMWNHLGDKNGVPGTYFYSKSVHHVPMWNVFDQVLMRPQILDNFSNSEVRIITKIGSKSLLKSSTKSIDTNISDHLPLLLDLNL